MIFSTVEVGMDVVFEKQDYFPLRCSKWRGGLEWPPMFHTHGELMYVTKGSVPLTVEGVTHELKAGELAILFPYLAHSYTKAPDAEFYLLLFEPAATAFDNTLLKSKPVCWWQDGRALQPLIERTEFMYRNNRLKTATAYMNALLGELLEELALEERGGADRDITVRLLSYCEEHCAQPITVQSIAEALYVSPSYVSKVFSRKLCYGFREYINALRIQKAKSLLLNTDKKILDVMLECGFQNQSSFNRVFRDVTGYSPREWRTAERQKME